jgi:hypothetical protein
MYILYYPMVQFYGVIHYIVTAYLGCKNVYFELWLSLDIETLVGNVLRIGKFYYFILNIYSSVGSYKVFVGSVEHH